MIYLVVDVVICLIIILARRNLGKVLIGMLDIILHHVANLMLIKEGMGVCGHTHAQPESGNKYHTKPKAPTTMFYKFTIVTGIYDKFRAIPRDTPPFY